MKCPVCNEYELVSQSLEDCFGRDPDIFCPKIIKMPGGKIFNHYRENHHNGQIRLIRIFAMPYRIITKYGKSQISMMSKYKSGNAYFKTVLNIPSIHTDLEEKMLERIKLLVLLS
jgi:hypothetical protein